MVNPESSFSALTSDHTNCAQVLNDRNVERRETGDAKGLGVYARRNFLPGETVVVGTIEKLDQERTIYTIQIDHDVHALFTAPAVSINHSCHPNTHVFPNSLGGFDFIALSEISAGSEITFDYATTEYESIAVPNCMCGTAICRGASLGFSRVPDNHPLKVARLVAPYLWDLCPPTFSEPRTLTACSPLPNRVIDPTFRPEIGAT